MFSGTRWKRQLALVQESSNSTQTTNALVQRRKRTGKNIGGLVLCCGVPLKNAVKTGNSSMCGCVLFGLLGGMMFGFHSSKCARQPDHSRCCFVLCLDVP